MSETIDIGTPEIFFDSITEVTIIEGVTRFALQVHRGDETVIVARLALPLPGLPDVIQELVILLTEAAKIIVKPPLSS